MTLEGRRDLDDTTGLIHYYVLLMLSAEDKEHGRCLGVYQMYLNSLIDRIFYML